MRNYILKNASLFVMFATKDSSHILKKKIITENIPGLNLSYASSVDTHSDTKVCFIPNIILMDINRSACIIYAIETCHLA